VSQPDHKALVRRYLEHVVNGLDLSVAQDLVAHDCVFHTPVAEMPTSDRDGLMAFLRFMHEAWEGLTITEEEMIAEGDTVAIRWSQAGRHVAEYFGFPPTGEVLEASGTAHYRIKDGQIAEAWLHSATYQLMAIRFSQTAAGG